MRNSAVIELIGYVGQEPKVPKPEQYPNFVTFNVAVSRSFKDKQGCEQKETSWFRCQTGSESMAKIVLSYVKQGCGILVKGYPKVNTFVSKDAKPGTVIEVNVTELNVLTNAKNDRENNRESDRDQDRTGDTFSDTDIPF